MEVLLRIRSTQRYDGEKAEKSEFLSQGTLWQEDDTLYLRYAESALTGLEGTTTTFAVQPHRIVLTREGKLRSEMRFCLGERHESLYNTGMGVCMVTILTEKLQSHLTLTGGSFSVQYAIAVEDAAVGMITYRIDVAPLEG
jgi:uncharacterized beta-barrel protein YwiB (DUF1934 family)